MAVAKFLQGYLLTCKLLQIVKKDPENKDEASYPQIFNVFLTECYQMFHREIIPLKRCDGVWIAPILDHLSAILCNLAVVADDCNKDSEKKTYVDFDANESDQ